MPLKAMMRPVPERCGVSLPSSYVARLDGTIRTWSWPAAGLANRSTECTGSGMEPPATVVTVLPPFTTTLTAGPASLRWSRRRCRWRPGARCCRAGREACDDLGLVGSGRAAHHAGGAAAVEQHRGVGAVGHHVAGGLVGRHTEGRGGAAVAVDGDDDGVLAVLGDADGGLRVGAARRGAGRVLVDLAVLHQCVDTADQLGDIVVGRQLGRDAHRVAAVQVVGQPLPPSPAPSRPSRPAESRGTVVTPDCTSSTTKPPSVPWPSTRVDALDRPGVSPSRG